MHMHQSSSKLSPYSQVRQRPAVNLWSAIATGSRGQKTLQGLAHIR